MFECNLVQCAMRVEETFPESLSEGHCCSTYNKRRADEEKHECNKFSAILCNY